MDKQTLSNLTYLIPENELTTLSFLFDHTVNNKDITLYFHIKRNATLSVEFIVTSDFNITLHNILEEEGASLSIRGICIARNTHTISITTLQHHQASHTHSNIEVRGILYNETYMQYSGTVRIDKGIKHVAANQENKNIMMSNTARVVSIPNLEILNNEVKCFHASAIGQLDTQHLLYLTARGIDEKDARKILLHAFLSEIITDTTLRTHLEQKLI